MISILDLSKEEILEIFDRTDSYLQGRLKLRLDGKIVSLAFFEPSTRTALSFGSATLSLGGKVLGFTSEESISIAKGENLADTIRMLDNYSDCIVIRHRFDGSAKFASEVAEKPVINAGDGKHEHPTQTLVDLYTVQRIFGSVEGLNFGILGDLRYARTVNSLLRGLKLFKPKRVYLISPPELRVREEIRNELNYPTEERVNPREVIGDVDVLYVTRIQKERFPDESEYERVKESYKVDVKLIEEMKKGAVILHPLPRVTEIDRRIDSYPHAKYFLQASLSVPLRAVLLSEILGGGNG